MKNLLLLLALALSGCATHHKRLPSLIAPHVATPGMLPDRTRTPGLANPDITQANIKDNICNPKWSTKSIRPPSSYTTALKLKQIRDWNLHLKPSEAEEDHAISLELGGHPTDPRNLWPEPYKPIPGAREKDKVEASLHAAVCHGSLTLAEAQRIISHDWFAEYVKRYGKRKP